MLKNFFKLNGQYATINEIQLEQQVRSHSEITNVQYSPSIWPPQLQRITSMIFRNVGLSKTTFLDTTFTDCDFIDCLFIGSEFQNVDFHNCTFVNCNFHKVEISGCYFNPKAIRLDPSYKRNAANIGVHLFQKLYENSSNARQPFFEMEADIKFRQWKRNQLIYDYKSGRLNLLQLMGQWLRSFIYQYLCGFGYRPARFAFATLILFFLISILNFFLFQDGLMINGQKVESLDFIDAVFYTFCVMTVLGFSSIVPTAAVAKLFTVLEAMVGVGWMGIFTSLLVKRLLK